MKSSPGQCFQVEFSRIQCTFFYQYISKLNKGSVIPMIDILFLLFPIADDIPEISRRIIRQMKCCNCFSIRCGKKSMNELLRFIHNKYAATDKWNTEYIKFIPY